MDAMTTPWWLNDNYTVDELLPMELARVAGPAGTAYVRVWKSGKTSAGWALYAQNGRRVFMPRYNSGLFDIGRVSHGYYTGEYAAGMIMRSLRVLAVDIDGKNGGVAHAEMFLQGAPPTLAETSKSGNGFHLFYLVDDTWDSEFGYGVFNDVIGVVPGVDIRAVGCVFHYPQQRWNGRDLATLPVSLHNALMQRQQTKHLSEAQIADIVTAGDPTELLLLQDGLMRDLQLPIPSGRRNNTLFAIGSKMKAAGVQNWKQLVERRGDALGLSYDETDKLVRNILKYG
jgi:hypothetical protein